ncbi:MAG: hypothetical protein JXA17_02770 [Dehalococcoidales bacterium]|nr:hypothetical protein [Dehalococcoidales bacterium]
MLVLSFSLIMAVPAHADVIITQASGGGAISADTTAGAWTDLGPISINETAVDEIAANQNGVTLILSIPAGFEFNNGQVPSISGLAGDITALGVTISSSNITVTFTTDALADITDNITIGAGPTIQVRPTAGTPLSSGNIARHATSNSTIAGIDGNTNFGTLTEVAGAITTLTIIQQPTDTLVNVAIAPAITVRATDQFSNNVTGQNIAVVLQAGTGALSGTSPRVTNASGIATFNDLQIDTAGPGKVLRFSFGGVTVDSNPFNITVAGITVNPTAGLITTEDGGTATFTIVLTSQPTNDVTIGLASSDLTEGTISADNVTFTDLNWDTPQDIIVTGVDDPELDGNIAYTIITAPAVSVDGNYNNLNASDVSVTNMDNEFQSVPPVEGVTDVSSIVTSAGLFTQEATVTSGDNNVQLTIDQGTTGLTAIGQPLSQLMILTLNFPPDPPENSSVIGLTYDFRPDGATFDQPVTITFTYNPNNIPPGVNEEDLSLAFYDDINGEWVVLQNIVVDPLTHTITGQTNHFTPFMVIAFTEPASFSVSELILSPVEIYIGETTTVSVTVTNTGDLSGTYSVALKIDDVVMETQQVTLNGHDSRTVDFSLSLNTAGTYNIGIGLLSGVLTVMEPTPTAAPTQTQEPAQTQTPAPPSTPEVVPSPPATLAPATPAQTAAPTPSPTVESGANWGMIGGIIGGVIVLAVVLGFWITHRRD